MVVIDATTLMLLLRPHAGVPVGVDNAPISQPAQRVAHLVGRLEKDRVKIVIPTPVLSEVLVRVDAIEAQKIVAQLQKFAAFRIEPFDERAAIEVAVMTRNAIDGGWKPGRRDPRSTWAKLKYDRQIVATAIVIRATAIYSDDRDIRAIARRANLKVIGLADLELPPEDAQAELPFLAKAEGNELEGLPDESAPE